MHGLGVGGGTSESDFERNLLYISHRAPGAVSEKYGARYGINGVWCGRLCVCLAGQV